MIQWVLAAILVICGASVLTACKDGDEGGATKDDGHAKKALLIILDGWGIGDKSEGDVIAQTATPYLDYLQASYPNTELQASGGYVGLPDGQMGNSETGHLNIGAGRIVYQDLVKINRACADNSILENPEIKAAYSYAKASGKNLHLMGLTSTGGVHSSLGHLLKLLDIAKEYGIPNCYVHCFMDGRDTDPRAGKGFIADVQRHMDETGIGGIATVIGRFWAMDRDKNWDRIKQAYDLLVHGQGREVDDMVAGVQSCYDSHTEEHKNTDEFMEPLVNGNIDGRIREGDVVIFFNFRSDRAKELTIVLTQRDMPEQGMTTIPNLQYYCMTPYDDSFMGVHILFPKDNLSNTLGEYIASQGLKQLHIAETEKYAHVTSFINGGREEPFAGEDRILVPSPKVATYDLKPEMAAFEIQDKLVAAINEKKYDFIVVNFANADMVGHTGVYTAIQSAVETIDQCLSEVVEAAKAMGYETIITADHGNADHALNADGTPNTAHSTNPVPLIYVTANKKAQVHSGALPDVAPSVLHIMGLQQPKEMTGQCLISE
ncbi:MAG: 2,3-bisphosphoglycerate-independent phosphoglycerate mutase [Bacteroidaceae bacterium]|nr:2,3-bisphosphoglycerate-independent phosphoglycerate mutase [Bacteroidaceae bacterium]